MVIRQYNHYFLSPFVFCGLQLILSDINTQLLDTIVYIMQMLLMVTPCL